MHTTDPLTPFGPCWAMSGAQNFFGEGWPYHSIYQLLPGFSFKGVTFVAKTTTLEPRKGQMPLKANLMPKELFPKSIYVNFRKKIVLNAVSLSGPGLDALLSTERWQMRTQPFFISFMSVEDSPEKRLSEWEDFVLRIAREHHHFHAKYGIQINLSCPNTQHKTDHLVTEAIQMLEIAKPLVDLGVVLVVKLSIDTSPKEASLIATNANCHGICVSNTIPFRRLPQEINWDELFGSLPHDIETPTNWNTYKGKGGSPLVRRGIPLAGGLSGEPLHPLVVDWVRRARKFGIAKHINAGGGILYPHQIDELKDAGASSFSVGSVAILRPYNLQKIVQRAHIVSQAPL